MTKGTGLLLAGVVSLVMWYGIIALGFWLYGLFE